MYGGALGPHGCSRTHEVAAAGMLSRLMVPCERRQMSRTPIFDALCLEHRSAGMAYPGSAGRPSRREPKRRVEPQVEVRSTARGSATSNRD